MPPKKKAVPKAKSAGLTISTENLSHITTRRPVQNEVEQTEEAQNLMNELLVTEGKHLNVTVVVEKMTDEYVAQATSLTENDETEKKTVQKKTAKAKSKSKQLEEEEAKPKKGRKRAVSEDRTLIYSEEKVIGNSRKRPANKDAIDSSDIISPLKRGRRAASVDIMPSNNVAVSTKEEIKKGRRVAKVTNFSDEVPKKGRKGAVKDNQPKTEKVIAKGKKTTKKVANEKIEEKEVPESTEVDGANGNQEKPKTKKGLKKGPQKSEDGENEVVDKVSKRTNRTVPKAKQNENKEVEKKSKRGVKSKQVVQTPNESEKMNDREVENDFEDENEENETYCVPTSENMPVKSKAKQSEDKEVEKKSKRVGKPKQVIQSPNDSEEMNDPEVGNDLEEKVDEDETDWVQTPEHIRSKSKAKQNEDKEVEKKLKRVGKPKQVIQSPNGSEEMNDPEVGNDLEEKIDEDETDWVQTPEIIPSKTKQNENKDLEKKSKRVGKSNQVIQLPNESEGMNDPEVGNDLEEKIDEDETDCVAATPEKIPAKSKAKQNEDKELEKKSKRVGKSKQDKSSNESQDPQLVVNEPTERNNDNETDLVVTPVKKEAKSKAKRVGRKEKQNEVENNVLVEEKEIKLQKRRKAKGQDFEEAVEESEVGEEKTGDVPSGLPNTPESGKDEVKPVVKRKTKAKTTRR